MDQPPVSLRLPALRRYQVRVFHGLLAGLERHRGATFTVLFPRQAGKNELSAALIACLLAGNAARGGSVVVCAPTFTPQAAISLERTRSALGRILRVLPAEAGFRVNGAMIELGNARATFLSASPEAHVAGHTATLALIADEAQDIDADWFDRQFRPMAASTAASTVLFGTPWDGTTLLDRAVAANRARDAREHGRPSGEWLPFHHEATWRDVARSNHWYGVHVAAERERLGAQNPLFRTQYELETTSAAGRLFTADDLRAFEGAFPRLRAPLPGDRYAGGLDLGGEGEHADATVLTIARVVGRRCEVVEHVAFQGARFTAVVEGVVAAARHWGLAHLAVDASGLGAPLAGNLADALGGIVEPVVFTGPSKSAMGFALIGAARDRSLALYGDDGSPEAVACRAELRACRASSPGFSRLQWAAPAGTHDDYVTSLALCLHAARALGPARVAVGRVR